MQHEAILSTDKPNMVWSHGDFDQADKSCFKVGLGVYMPPGFVWCHVTSRRRTTEIHMSGNSISAHLLTFKQLPVLCVCHSTVNFSGNNVSQDSSRRTRFPFGITAPLSQSVRRFIASWVGGIRGRRVTVKIKSIQKPSAAKTICCMQMCLQPKTVILALLQAFELDDQVFICTV